MQPPPRKGRRGVGEGLIYTTIPAQRVNLWRGGGGVLFLLSPGYNLVHKGVELDLKMCDVGGSCVSKAFLAFTFSRDFT